MQVFTCDVCGQPLHFENFRCLSCDSTIGYLSDRSEMSSYTLAEDGTAQVRAAPDAGYRVCGNAVPAGCNWLVATGSGKRFCRACDLNRTIPDLKIADNQRRWRDIESAKRRLIYALDRFGLPLSSHRDDSKRGLAFDFLGDTKQKMVMTGHASGLITINIAEADPDERERRRVKLGEPYRTLLGHFRHEVGHYYWDLLVRDGGMLERSRAVFGDERASYADAAKRHYQEGPPEDWQRAHVSSYATMHPWEDFAETWTHYFHIVDTLDTAASFGISLSPQGPEHALLNTEVAFDPYARARLADLVTAWVPLTVALNSINRSMGQNDLYPFALSPTAIGKLSFIHDLVHGAA